ISSCCRGPAAIKRSSFSMGCPGYTVPGDRSQSLSGHALQGTADQFFAAESFFLDRVHRPAGLLRLVAQSNEVTDRIRGARGCLRSGTGCQRRRAGQAFPGRELALELDQQACGSLLAYSRNPGQGTGILSLDRADELIHLEPGHECQGQLGPHAVEPDQLTEQLTITLVGKGIEQLRILAHNQMGMQGGFFAQRRQPVEGTHRRLHLVTHTTHIQQNLRWLLLQQYACKPTNHCVSLMSLPDSKYCPAPPRASTPPHATSPQADQTTADLLLESYGVGMAQGDCQRIRRVRLGCAGETEQLSYHV